MSYRANRGKKFDTNNKVRHYSTDSNNNKHFTRTTLSRSSGRAASELAVSAAVGPANGGGTLPYAGLPSAVLSLIGWALNGRPDGGGGRVSSDNAGGI